MSPAPKLKPDDLLVISPLKEFTCADCGTTEADLMRLEDDTPHCLACMDLDHLIFLPSGNTALTRRARKARAGTRSSGRVGRSAAGRALEENAVTLAVVASIRHENTPYDELLMAGVARSEARDQIREQLDQVLESWRAG